MRLLSLVIVLCVLAGSVWAAANPFRGFHQLKTPVDISAISLSDPSGQNVHVSDWRGSWVLLNAWATWCAPCIMELPELDKLSKANAFPNLKVVAVSFDVGKSSGQIREFLAARGIGPFAAYTDPSHQLQTTLKSAGLPMTYLVNPEGQVVASYRGAANWIDPNVFQELSRLIN